MDSTNNDMYGGFCAAQVMLSLRKTGQEFYFYAQNNPEKPLSESHDTFSRQVDEYQCGVFALKDARNP